MNFKNKIMRNSILIFLCFFLCIFGKGIIDKILNMKEKEEPISEVLTIERFWVNETDNYDGEYFIMKVGEVFQPTFSFQPLGISEFQQKMIWTNSDSSVVSINHNGVFTALKPGVVSIIATSSKNENLQQTLKVKVVANTNAISFDYALISQKQIYGVGQVVKLNYNIIGTISLGDVLWKSSDESIATVENGYVKAIGMGKAKIILTSLVDSNYTCSLDIEVRGYYNVVEATEVTFGNKVKVDIVNYDFQDFLRASIRQENIITIYAQANQNLAEDVYFTFSNEDMVKVLSTDENSITFQCLKTGDLTIHAISSYFPNIWNTLTFTIRPYASMGNLELTSPSTKSFVEINGDQVYEMQFGTIIPVAVSCDMKNVDVKYLSITSSNAECVVVMDQYIKAIHYGESIIQICDKNNMSNSVSFKVVIKENSNSSYTPLEIMSCENMQLNQKTGQIVDYDVNIVHPNDSVEFDLVFYPLFSTNLSCYDIFLTNSDIANIDVNHHHVKIYFHELGETTLIIRSYDNTNLDIVYDFIVENNVDVDFSYTKITLLERGQTGNLDVIVPDDIKGVTITYTSSHPNIASVGHAGEIVGLDYGTSEITIFVTDGQSVKEEKFEVEIIKEHSLYEALSSFHSVVKKENTIINLNETLFFIGDVFTIDVSFTPQDHPFGAYHDIKIENDSLLSMKKEENTYTFTALQNGKTKITIYPYANTDFKEEFYITIANIMPQFMFISVPDKKMYVNDKYQFGYLVDWRATYKEVDIIIEDESIASIEEDYLYIKKAGTTSIVFCIDDHDENTVSYIQTLTIETIEHSNLVKLERYGYETFVMRILFQIIVVVVIGVLSVFVAKQIKGPMNDIVKSGIICGGILALIVILNIVRMNISTLKYEKYDIIMNITSYIIGVGISLLTIVIHKKQKGKGKQNDEKII